MAACASPGTTPIVRFMMLIIIFNYHHCYCAGRGPVAERADSGPHYINILYVMLSLLLLFIIIIVQDGGLSLS